MDGTVMDAEERKEIWIRSACRYAGLTDEVIDSELRIYLSEFLDQGYTAATAGMRLREYLGVK